VAVIDKSCLVYGSSREFLLQHALEHEQAVLTQDQVLAVTTGERTGRSTRDRYIVADTNTKDNVSWGRVNQPISPVNMEKIWQKAIAYQKSVRCFVSDLQVGASDKYKLGVQAITEYAWHQLFVRNLFIRSDCETDTYKQCWTLLSLPGMLLEPKVDQTFSESGLFIDFTNKRVLLCGLRYAGEMKKAMFSVQNYLLPMRGVLPMHCAATVGENKDVTLLFGLSGTGKTALSADLGRDLIGDDEHGWSAEGVFNIENGCYAKCKDLSFDAEPKIWHAVQQSRTILENVKLIDGVPDFSDCSITANMRAAYPRDVMPGCVVANAGATPRSVVFLSCDLYGVLPPVSCLSLDQAMYWFLNGYTALVGSTEVGTTKAVQPTFSSCFGAPFFPRSAQVYAGLLRKRVLSSQAQVYLVNTGWHAGAFSAGGERCPIAKTRQILRAIEDGRVLAAEKQVVTAFALAVPKAVSGLDDIAFDPSQSWEDQDSYRSYHDRLFKACEDNMQKYSNTVDLMEAR